MNIIELLNRAVAIDASDIHLSVGTSPVFRISGKLSRLLPDCEKYPVLTKEKTQEITKTLMSEEQYGIWEEKGELDFTFSLPGTGRFRINAYRQRGCASLAIRPVPSHISSLESLGVSLTIASLAEKKHGLVLVTGTTGSGKSTTLAAMINKINQERECHIITIEDPIEYLYQHQKSVVDQREIGSDTYSMSGALRACLRQDPDVIFVGEMRDLETIATAITAAETGHLVFATLHTNSAAKTVDRIIDVFPPSQQEQIKIQLAATLQGVVTQQLVPDISGKGRVLAAEVLIVTPAVRSLIRENKSYQIPAIISSGGRWGMQTMDMALIELVRTGKISAETALKYCGDRAGVSRLLNSPGA